MKSAALIGTKSIAPVPSTRARPAATDAEMRMKWLHQVPSNFLLFAFVFLLPSISCAQAASGSSVTLWQEFEDSVSIGNDRRSFQIMSELCKRDGRISDQQRGKRFTACYGDANNRPPCTSDSALNDHTRFFLYSNCKVIAEGTIDTVCFARHTSSGPIDFFGLASKQLPGN